MLSLGLFSNTSTMDQKKQASTTNNQNRLKKLSDLMLGDFEKFKEAALENKDIIKTKNHDGETLLHKVIDMQLDREKHIALVQFLIDNGIDVNAQNNNERAPIHSAICFLDKESFDLLIKCPSLNPNIKDCYGYTTMHYIISRANREKDKWNKKTKEMLKSLLDHKDTDPNIQHKFKSTPFEDCIDTNRYYSGSEYRTLNDDLAILLINDPRTEFTENIIKRIIDKNKIELLQQLLLTPHAELVLKCSHRYFDSDSEYRTLNDDLAILLINDPRTEFTEKIIKRIIDNDKIESLQQLLLTPHAELVLKCSQYARSKNKDNIANLLENPAPFLQKEAVRKFGTSIANALRVRQITGNTGKIFKTMTKQYEYEIEDKKMIVGLKDMPKTINFNPQKRVALKIKLRKTSF